MKKNIFTLITLLIVVLPVCVWSQNTINFNGILVGRYDTPPPQFPAMKVAHFDNDSLNPCSSGYFHWAVMSGTDNIVVGPLSNTTDLNINHSGQNEPLLSLKLTISNSQSGPWTDLPFNYSGAGPCFSINTDIVDQGKFIKIESKPGKFIRIHEIKAVNGLLPVELVAFSATRTGDNVQLKWQTKTEANNYGFEVQRYMNNEFQRIGFVEGHGTVNTPQKYSHIDGGAGQVELKYRLKQIDRDGKFKYSSIITVAGSNDKSFTLLQAAPNPFNPQTTIYYNLKGNEVISLFITDFYGREVKSLVSNTTPQPAGNYSVVFTATELPSGTYFVWLKGETKSSFLRIEFTK